MSELPAPYTTPACWCRNCDNAAKSGLSPLAALRLGSRFIVCPDCGNKRCPKGMNHELACTNSNESGQKGSEWESIKPCPKSAETTPAEAPAPAPLSAERLAEILADDTAYGTLTNFAPELVWQRRQLLRHAVALKFALNKATALTAQAEAQVAGLKVELGEQERAKLLLIQETYRWSDAVKALEAERVAKPVQNDAYDDKGNCWQCGRFSTECNGWHD